MDVVFYDERLLGQALPTSEELISYCARELSGQTSPPGTPYAVLSTGYSCEDHPYLCPYLVAGSFDFPSNFARSIVPRGSPCGKSITSSDS
jgi:hypothetical protein